MQVAVTESQAAIQSILMSAVDELAKDLKKESEPPPPPANERSRP